MAVVVAKLRCTAIGNIPTSGIPALMLSGSFYLGGVAGQTMRLGAPASTSGGSQQFDFGNYRVDQNSTNVITAGTVTLISVYDSTGSAPANPADRVDFTSYSTTANLFRFEFLDASNVVLATYNASATSPNAVSLVLGTPVTPPFWTALSGASELV